jgi:hypothetical protein
LGVAPVVLNLVDLAKFGGFYQIGPDFSGFFPRKWDLSPKRAQKEGGSWDFDPQLKFYINKACLSILRGKIQQNDEEFVKFKPFLCREAIEEASFGGHFWEFYSTFFSVVYCIRFLRQRRTQHSLSETKLM